MLELVPQGFNKGPNPQHRGRGSEALQGEGRAPRTPQISAYPLPSPTSAWPPALWHRAAPSWGLKGKESSKNRA